MTWITEVLGVGSAKDAADSPMLVAERVGWVVNLAQECAVSTELNTLPQINYRGIMAGAPLVPLVKMVREILQRGERVLIHCVHGINRSPSIAICVLIALGKSRQEAWDLVIAAKPEAVPYPALVDRFDVERTTMEAL